MKAPIIICVVALFFSGWRVLAQEVTANPIPDFLYTRYMTEIKDLSVIYNGKEEILSGVITTNHSYLVTDEFTPAILWYNQTGYNDILMRYDLSRDELIVRKPDTYKGIILEKEKVNSVFLNGYWIVVSESLPWVNKPGGNYLLLLSDGDYPVIKKNSAVIEKKVDKNRVISSYNLRESLYICINNVCYPVKNKGSVLKLFPDKKKELEAYIKQHKLNFGAQREQSIVSIVEYYQNLIK